MGSWSKCKENDDGAVDINGHAISVYEFDEPPVEYNTLLDTTFKISADRVEALQTLAAQLIPGSVLDGGAVNPETVMGIYSQRNNLTGWINNFAGFMTQGLQTVAYSSPASQTYYLGTVFKDQSYVVVRWAWLAFPAVMLLGTCLLLVTTVWRTDRSLVRP